MVTSMQTLQQKLYTLLRWSEIYTKTDMVYLFRGSVWSGVAQMSTAVISFALAVIVSRYVPPDDYGNYKYILATIAVLSTFSLSGLGTAVFQSTARGFDGALQEGFWQNIRWSALVFIGAIAAATYYFVMGNTLLACGMLLGGCFSPFLASANLASSFLGGKKDFFRQSIYFGLLGSGIPLMALIGAIWVSTNPLWLVFVFLITNTLSSLYFYKKTILLYHPDPAKKDPEMMTYSKHLSVLGVLGGIAGNIDQILIFHYIGAVELAIYNFATAILDQTGGPLKTISNMMTAKYATHTDQEINRSVWNKVFWFFLLALGIVVVYVPLAPYIYGILFPGYVSAVPYSQLYAFSIFSMVFNPFGSYLVAKKKIKAQYLISFINYTCQILFIWIGIVFWGLWGLIWARIILRNIVTGINYILYRQTLEKTL